MGGELVQVRERIFEGSVVRQRASDGYWDATQMCKAAGKKWADYWRLNSTGEYIQALAESTGIPTDAVVELKSGRSGGTWVHPDIAIHLAQWCSPRFAVQVSRWVRELLATGRVDLPNHPANRPTTPWDHRVLMSVGEHKGQLYSRYGAGAFTIMSALSTDILTLGAVLWEHGLPTGPADLPDGSIGIRWAAHAREAGLPGPIGTAQLLIPASGAKVDARVYRGADLLTFYEWFRGQYVPTHLHQYLTRKPEFRECPRLSVDRAAVRASVCLSGRPAALPPRSARRVHAAKTPSLF